MAGRRWRAVVGGIGEVFITIGVVLVLFVVWQLGFVAIVDSNAQIGVVSQLEAQFAAGGEGLPDIPLTSPGGTATDPGGTSGTTGTTGNTGPKVTLEDGKVFAILRVPRLGGPGWARPIYEGVGLPTLAKGLGRYPDTALPGAIGNFAVAGHRAGHGNPLINIDAIRDGDVMVVETRSGYAVYRAQRHTIVPPTSVDVVAAVPQKPGVKPTEAWFTLTSCDPRFSSTNRYIVFAKLERVIPRAEGLPADLLADPR